MKRALSLFTAVLMLALLSAQTTAPSAPATTQAASVALVDLLPKLPAELKPLVGEPATQKTARDAWFKTQIGDKALRLTMTVGGANLEIEPRNVVGNMPPNITIDATFDKATAVPPLQMGDEV